MKGKILISLFMLLAACSAATTDITVTTFEECVEQTGIVMESYPRQCSFGGETFVEDVMPLDATACPDPRPTGITREYMPVLGSDGEEYQNWRMACSNEAVEWYQPVLEEQPSEPVSLEGETCSEQQKQAQICTLEYMPRCGLVPNDIQCVTAPCATYDAVDFGNSCAACAGQADVHYPGTCADIRFVVNKETVTGFDPVQFAQDTGAVLVDICPANMDSYVTQIGVEMCILHYGEEEISSWPVCEQSSSDCDCVRAIETTDNQEISDPQYRCVPEQYATRMLFRSGTDRLDENGEQSVVIA